MHLTHEEGRTALADELASWSVLLGADQDLDAPSRCAGWSCAHVLVHVHLGLHEVALALLDVEAADAPGAATVDAAGYWTGYPATTDAQRQTQLLDGFARAYPDAATLTAHLAETVAALGRGLGRTPAGRVGFQGQVLSTGDFLGSWAVELAVHHLDLDLVAAPPAASALRVARRTVEDLAGGAVPADWDDATVVLAGTGRVALTGEVAAQHPALAARFPVLR
nr:maleylpyruvate isomerase N-terminal domain-containing protein [Kineococcus aurantiacus]